MMKNYIEGKFQTVEDPVSERKHFSPFDLSQQLATVSFGFKDIDRAVESSRRGRKAWSTFSKNKKVEVLRRVVEFIQANEDKWVAVLSSHSGLCEWDAREEISRSLVSAKEQLSFLVQNFLEEKYAGSWMFDPVGSVAIIGSFSESVLYGIQECLRYLVSGNSVVYKPSEKLFLTGQLLSEAFHFAQLPAGVFNMIYGDREVGRRLVVHEGVDAVSFMGGYESAIRIKQDTLQQSWKKLCLSMCGKSLLIIDREADLSKAVDQALLGGFSFSGQCADSTSRILVHSHLRDEFMEKLHLAAKQVKIGASPQTKMGALIDDGAVDRYIKFQGIAAREGAEIVMRGKALDTGTKGYLVTPSIMFVKSNDFEQNRRSVYLQTEIFGPNLAVQSFDESEEALQLANNNQFPLAVSVCSESESRFNSYAMELRYSRVIWNQSTRTTAFGLPQTGTKKTGNQSMGGSLGFLDTGISRAIIKP